MGAPFGARLLIFSDGVSGCITALAMVRWRESRLITNPSPYGFFYRVASYRAGQNTFREEAIGFQGFVVDFAESRNGVVPLEESCSVTNPLNGTIVKVRDRIDQRMIVSIEDIFFVLGMAGDVNLRETFGGNAVNVIEGIKAVILRGDVNIVDVQEDAAISAFDDFVQEFPFGHFGDVKFGVAADVFDGNGNFQIVSDIANFLRGFFRRLESVRHRKQVVSVAAVNAAPAEVIGKPGSFGTFYQFLEAAQVLAVDTIRGTEVHGDAVLHHTILIDDLIEDVQRPAAIDHEVFGNDFEPVTDRFTGEDVIVMRGAQTDADAVVREPVEAISRQGFLQRKSNRIMMFRLRFFARLRRGQYYIWCGASC